MKLIELLAEFEGKSYDDLVKIGKKELDIFRPECVKADKVNEGNGLLVAIVTSAIGADYIIAKGEGSFVGEVFGMSKDELRAIMNAYSIDAESFEKTACDFCKSLDEEKKTALKHFVLCIFASDREIVLQETAFLQCLMF